MVHFPVIETLMAGAFAAIFLGGRALQQWVSPAKGKWGSAAAGIAIAYVFVHILPELAESQRYFSEAARRRVPFLEFDVYLAALAGFLVFYGMDDRPHGTGSAEGEGKSAATRCRLRLAAHAGYAGLASYLLFRGAAVELRALLLYGFAIAMHFVAMDHDLRRDLGAAYELRGRWALAGAAVAGWALGMVSPAPRPVLAPALGFLAGAVVINSALAELPSAREGQFWRFCLGAVGYALVLVLA
jgi:hypothetical protein